MTEKTTEKIGRRDVLKIVVAGAGAITASAFLPDKWVKPVADFGVSPAHAQASIAPIGGGTISGLVYRCDNTANTITGADVAVVSTAFSTLSLVDGTYSIAGVPVGNYSVKCTIGPGPTDFITLGPFAVTAGGTVTVDFNFNAAC
jgi:hypothetical protein